MSGASCPARPALRWFGGKWILAPWIIQHLPPHRTYVEPFAGAASVLLRKPRSYAEVYNDLDGDAVALFRVLRDATTGAALERRLRLTPFARDEWQAAYEPCGDDVERAARLVIRSFMGFGSMGHRIDASTGFRANSNRSGTTPAHDWANYPDVIPALIERMRGVCIENRDALACMAQHDGPDTVHYLDPPYLPETRSSGGYRHDMTADGHVRLLAELLRFSGMIVLSGYPNPQYDAALYGWHRIQRQARSDGAQPRTEVLWLNPKAASRVTQRGLFDAPMQAAE